MRAGIAKLILSRRTLLVVGIPVSALVALCSVASVSFFPPAIRGSSLGYAVARMQLYVGPNGGLVDTQLSDVPQQSIDQAIALADQMGSPRIRNLIAANSGIARDQIAVDGPLDVYQSVFDEEPDGEKRASQVIVQNARYRVIINEDTALPEIAVTAQAPTSREAVSLASATRVAVSSYLSGIETASKTPRQRPLGSVVGGRRLRLERLHQRYRQSRGVDIRGVVRAVERTRPIGVGDRPRRAPPAAGGRGRPRAQVYEAGRRWI